MKNCYINGIGNVSAQDSTNADLSMEMYLELGESVVHAHKPNYKDYIKPALIRRMSPAVKMGVVASSIALKEADVEVPNAIITGTGLGCMVDSEKFLRKMVYDNEQFLTPTSFIQSTHNTVGGQIALGLSCNAYNVTHVHGSTSFESSLIDGMLMMEDDVSNILIGGVDEISDYTVDLYNLIGHVKNQETLAQGILRSKSSGAIFSEGAQFFVLDQKIIKNSYAKLLDVEIYNSIDKENIEDKVKDFIDRNNILIEDIDSVIFGINGDIEFDYYYEILQVSMFENTQQLYYKHLSGEYHSCSAFGFWTACRILKDQNIPDILKLNHLPIRKIKYILLYNQYRGGYHSFTLLSRC